MKSVYLLKLKWLFYKIGIIEGDSYDFISKVYDLLLAQDEKCLTPEQERRIDSIYDEVRYG